MIDTCLYNFGNLILSLITIFLITVSSTLNAVRCTLYANIRNTNLTFFIKFYYTLLNILPKLFTIHLIVSGVISNVIFIIRRTFCKYNKWYTILFNYLGNQSISYLKPHLFSPLVFENEWALSVCGQLLHGSIVVFPPS